MATTTTPTALVMAGSKGLGYASAEALGRSGHTVALCGRDSDALGAAARQLEEAGIEALPVTADVADPDALSQLFARVDDALGRLDVLVANAGGPPAGNFDDLDDAAWERAFELTFMSAVRSIRHALPRFRAVGGGRVIVIGSSSVRRPIPGLTSSNAMRPGLAGLVKSLATELGPEGITVNMVSPGRIETERTRTLDAAAAEREGSTSEDIRARTVAGIPMGRMGEPHELGAMVAHLASPASAYVTGQSILVDGGLAPTLP
ncbi:SDR family oxidoreductase [Egibacter rhizosphaerae]|uniref:SDR family oxidoreductase n=1 Tax=Egibacter rhizosphaerae TaxID=1670831 RepID=A0A411YGY9_9ACTN|nr:SDR family oxidoreductase [Egibacter rhizosphaerae]QBI20483.1 SDR family oxidoreductase [Egibacter rhizosphaerae]